MCYEDEGVYVNTYGRITKDVVLQWGEMPTSVGMTRRDEASVRGATRTASVCCTNVACCSCCLAVRWLSADGRRLEQIPSHSRLL